MTDEDACACLRALWQGAGLSPPEGGEMDHHAAALARAQALGRAVPRQTDRTLAPMLGPRTDITPRRRG